MQCLAVFTTEETANYSSVWRVTGKNSSLLPFQSVKLLISVHNSCQHRPDAINDAAALVDTIINKLQPQAVNGLLAVSSVRSTTLATLRQFDAAAAVHYHAFHPIRQPKP